MKEHPLTRRAVLAGGATLLGGALAGATRSGEKNSDPKPGSRKVQLALVQMRCDGSTAENLARASNLVGEAAKRGAQVVVLPELFQTPYFCQHEEKKSVLAARRQFAQPVPGPATQRLAAAAREHRVVLVGGSVYEKSGDGMFFNTAPVFDTDGKLLGCYRKSHIPHDPCFREQHYFAKGDTGVRVFDTSFGRLAVQICYDQWFPEFARLAALRGAELLVYPTAIGDVDHAREQDERNWREMWTGAQVGHAICNGLFVAAVNRVGREGKITFWGGSFAVDPGGRVLEQAGAAEEITVVTCDLDRVKKMQESWRFVAERRPEQYQGLAVQDRK